MTLEKQLLDLVEKGFYPYLTFSEYDRRWNFVIRTVDHTSFGSFGKTPYEAVENTVKFYKKEVGKHE